jgi:predicted esterase
MIKTLLPALLLLAAAAPQESDGDKALPHVDRPPAKRRPGAPLGILLCFHGANGNANSLLGSAEEMLGKASVRDDYVVIGLKSKDVGWTDKDDAPVKAFVPWALKKYGADPRRVFGYGVSSGAWFLNRFAPENSDLLAGAISYVGGMGRVPASKEPAGHAELYWVIGHKDDGLPPSRTRPQAEAYFKAGFHAVYREMLDHAHEGPKDPTMTDAAEWLGGVRNKRIAPAGEDAAFLKKFEDEERSESLLSQGATWARLAQIGGAHAAPVVSRGLKSERAGIRAGAAKAASLVLLDDAVVEALAGLVEDKDAAAKRAALGALAFQARWNRPAARAALCAVASDDKRTAGDRRVAAQGLADAVKLDVLGTYLYRDALKTLIGLLEDRDGGLRQVAFSALQPIQADGFGYSPSMAEGPRAKAVQRWTEWLEKVAPAK